MHEIIGGSDAKLCGPHCPTTARQHPLSACRQPVVTRVLVGKWGFALGRWKACHGKKASLASPPCACPCRIVFPAALPSPPS